jgi:hypothetical protein
MKKIQFNAIITGIRSKVDGSLGITLGTPEMSPEEKAEFMRLQGVNLIALFAPLDEKTVPTYKINRDLENKTPAQRLRGVLYIMWEQAGMKGDFDEFYRKHMEKIMDTLKDKLD